MQRQKKKILAVVEDLFFTVKINDAAKRAGMDIEFVKSEKDLVDKATERADLVIIDLNSNGVQPLEIILRMKREPELKQISMLGFVSHVQGELKQAAHDAGCDMVMARSAFSQNLPQILKRHAGSL